MGVYARIQDGTVAELFTTPPGMTIAECFAPGLLWVDVTNVLPQPVDGWTASETNDSWVFAAPVPVVPPVVVPVAVANYQVRAVLLEQPGMAPGKTLLDDFNTWIAAQGGVAYQAWEYSIEVRRDSALIAAAAAEFGFTDARLNAMFVEAAAILA